MGYQDWVDNTGFNGMPQVVLDYDYDAEGKLESVTEIIEGVEGATTRYDYDERDQVKSITQSGNGTSDKRVEFDYSPIGQFEGIRRYSDVDGTQLVAATDYDYDDHNRLESLTHNNGANESLAFYDFAYDEAHRIDAITDVDGTTDYDYDQTNQLISAQHSDVDKPDESYGYDKNGNRAKSHLHGTGYVTEENNQLKSDGIYTYTYDDQGNMKTQTRITTGVVEEFEWDYRNRLTSIITRDDTGTVTQEVNYVYDVMGRRIAKTLDPDGDGATSASTTHFVYDGNNVLMEFVDDSSTPSQRYLHGPRIDQVLAQDDGSGQPLWLLADHLGTVHDVVDNSGTVVNHITFDSFGNVLNQTDDTFSTRYLFTGREFDTETGLYYYRSRYYNSEIGRFISQDSIGFEGGDMNLYRYAQNSPVVYSDPFGEKVYVTYRSFVSLGGPGHDVPGERILAGLLPALHTSIVLEPDKICDFQGDSDFNSGMAIISGWWGWSSNVNFAQELTALINDPRDAPEHQWGGLEVQTPSNTDDTTFIKNIIGLTRLYMDGQSDRAPYQFVPGTAIHPRSGGRVFDTYNSNSFVSGVISSAGGNPPSLPVARVAAPGYNKPIKLPYDLPEFLDRSYPRNPGR